MVSAWLWQSILRSECPYCEGTPQRRHTYLIAWDAHAAGTLPGHSSLSSAAIRVACWLSGVEVGCEEFASRRFSESLGLVTAVKCMSLFVLADAGVAGVDLRRVGRLAAEADPKSGAGRIGERLLRALRSLECGERFTLGLGLEARLWDLFRSLHPVLGLWVHSLGHQGSWLRHAVAGAARLFASLAFCALLLLAGAEDPVIPSCVLPDAGLAQELDFQIVLGDCGIAVLGGLAALVVTALLGAGGALAGIALLIGSVLVVLVFMANVCMVDVDHWIVALFARLAISWLLAPAAQVALCHAVCAHAAGRRPAVLRDALRYLRLAIAPDAAAKLAAPQGIEQGSSSGVVHISLVESLPDGSPSGSALKAAAGGTERGSSPGVVHVSCAEFMSDGPPTGSALKAAAGGLLEPPPPAPTWGTIEASSAASLVKSPQPLVSFPCGPEAPDPPGFAPPDLLANLRPRLPHPMWGEAAGAQAPPAPDGYGLEPPLPPRGLSGARLPPLPPPDRTARVPAW